MKPHAAPATVVAQTRSLLYRRFVIGNTWTNPALSTDSTRCRMQSCDIADCKSALRLSRDRRPHSDPYAGVKEQPIPSARLAYWISFTAVLILVGCKPPSSTPAKPTPPAKVSQIAKEDALTSIVLTPEAEQRLGIVTASAISKRVARTRTFGGELILALGRSNSTGLPEAASATNQNRSIYSLLPAMTPAELIRLAELQVDADGQAAAAKVQLEAMQVTLKRAENMLAEKAGSLRTVDEAKAQSALAAAALQTARARRDLLGTPLFEAVKQDVLWVRVPVYVGDLANLKTSEPARAGELGGPTNQFTHLAKPVSVPISATTGANTMDVFYEIENKDGAFRPGQRIAVQIPWRGEQESLVVPASAVIYDINGGTWVYEKTAPHGFVRRRVEVRFMAEAEAAVARGLPAGANVVTVGAAELFGTEFGFGK
jgi:hypothetical protein